MMVLQGCAGVAGTPVTPATQCAKPTLTPSETGQAITSVRVTIATATPGAYLRYTLEGSAPTGGPSGNGTEIPAAKGKVMVNFGPGGTTLKAIAYKAGMADSPIAEATYVYQSPY
jgi:Chitobiase/beta-hexosaminidase C-terminal domain